MGEGDGEGGGLGAVAFPLSFSRTQQYCFTQGCYPRPANTIPPHNTSWLGENCAQQLYRRAATVANEQQDYHSDPCCY